MLPGEPLHATPKVGTRYKAAGGQTLVNAGEKRVTFQAGKVIGAMSFQAIDEVSKPLASAARITETGNMIVFNDQVGESYILNHKSGQKIPFFKEDGVFIMNVEYLLQAFARQAP